MSWNFSFSAESKEAAKAELRKQPAIEHCPEEARAAIDAAIDALPPVAGGSAITVQTYGHFEKPNERNNSNLTVTVGSRLA